MDAVVGNGTDLAYETESTGLTDYGMYCTMYMLTLQAWGHMLSLQASGLELLLLPLATMNGQLQSRLIPDVEPTVLLRSPYTYPSSTLN